MSGSRSVWASAEENQVSGHPSVVPAQTEHKFKEGSGEVKPAWATLETVLLFKREKGNGGGHAVAQTGPS